VRIALVDFVARAGSYFALCWVVVNGLAAGWSIGIGIPAIAVWLVADHFMRRRWFSRR
jgi:hypothetical protein